MHPIISVIVPIYNAELYLVRCIESMIHQTYCALQIILINDGSTDNSLAIAEKFAAQDKRIEVYSQSNQGQSAARNNGLQHAIGEYLSFVDADDYLDCDFYETLITHSSLQDIIHFGFRRVTTDGQLLYEHTPKYHYRYTAPWTRLIRRQWLLDHHITFPEGMYYEDVVFTMNIWLQKPKQTITPYIGYNYVLNSTSTTTISHQLDKERLFSMLRDKKKHATWCNKILILYTIIRLKFHFKRYDKSTTPSSTPL